MLPVLVLLAFLSGSIPFGLLIARAKGIDIRKHGSGNIGATNVGRVLGRRYFFLCFALDLLKGLVPTLAMGYALGRLGHFDVPARDALWWLGAMVAAILGHVFCPWLKFKGGKGVATGLGALLGVFPPLAVPVGAALLVWLAALAVWRYISLSSIFAGLTLPTAVVVQWKLLGRSELRDVLPFIAVAALLTLLVLWTHRANVARLRAGKEPKVGQRVHLSQSPPASTPGSCPARARCARTRRVTGPPFRSLRTCGESRPCRRVVPMFSPRPCSRS